MNPADASLPADPMNELLSLGRELGREQLDLAILGEGNVSVRTGADTFLVKASGRNLRSLGPDGLVECRQSVLLKMLDQPGATDAQIESNLYDSRVDPGAPKPSVEAVFHALLLDLPRVRFVGHTHGVAVNAILCSPRAEQFARERIFPDEIVCCGPSSVFVPYVDPGLPLAVAIRDRTHAWMRAQRDDRAPPRVILLASHGLITLGPTRDAVLAAMLMASKAARIWLAAAALDGPVTLPPSEVRRIASRADEEYRRRALNI
ncbi:MAG: class II aldolase/adducin family protein [Phycisphaerae bacterium]|nr:class II aldolase/adducin family protein [Phycisphaerae bacterium]